MTEMTVHQDSGSLAKIDTADLKRALFDAIDDTVSAIRRAAEIWAELERRGEDLTDVKFALRVYLRPVAAGMLMPEVVARLAGQRRTLDLVATLPPIEQKRVAVDDEPISIVTASGEVEQKPLSEMTWPEVARAIRDGAVRTIPEQKAGMARTKAASAPRARRGRPPRIQVDTAVGMVKIGATDVPLDSLLVALRAAGALD